MTRTTNASIGLVAGMVVMLVAAMAFFVRLDSAGLAGMAIGAALGLVNMAVSYKLAARSLKQGMKSAMAVLLGGFFARLVALATLILLFQKTPSIDATSFALAFMILFFANLLLEILLVSRSLRGNGGTA